MGACWEATIKHIEADEENCVVKCCKATTCHATAKCTKANADFLIDTGTWKTSFGTPARWCSCLGPYGLLGVRAVLFFFWFGILIWRISAGVKFYYLTNWTMLWQAFSMGFDTFTTFMAVTSFHGIPDGKGKATPWFASVAWALQGTALIMSVLVFLLYWILDYSVVCGTPEGCPVVDFANIAVHGINCAVMIVDVFVCRQPFHLAHIFVPFVYAITYLIFNICYQAASGKVLYTVLDWQGNTSTAVIVAGAVVLVVTPCFYILCFFLVRGRGSRVHSTPDTELNSVSA